MKILNVGEKVAIVACSDLLDLNQKDVINEIEKILISWGLEVVISDYIYKNNFNICDSFKKKAEALMDCYKDKSVKAIFDVSGGNLANGILNYLDYEIIRDNPKPFFGYSDVTVILNSLYKKVETKSYLYQIKNIVSKFGNVQSRELRNLLMEEKNELLQFKYEWVQGNFLEGVVLGGNIRCLLKLSGTEFMPDFTDKILFLESFSGGVNMMITLLIQLKQQGILKKVKGIILGYYTEMQRDNLSPRIEEIVKEIVEDINLPIIKTNMIGHNKDSKCLVIGENVRFE